MITPMACVLIALVCLVVGVGVLLCVPGVQSVKCRRLSQPAPACSGHITTFICTSPRFSDTDRCLESIVKSAAWARRFLQGAVIIVADGRHPSKTDEEWAAYRTKLSKLQELEPNVVIDQGSEWRHQALSLRRSMGEHLKSPFVFVLQDDCALQVGEEDVAYIMTALCNSPDVSYVKLWWGSTPAQRSAQTNEQYETKPGKPHPTFPKLTSTHFWSDRPHFALAEHYRQDVWPHFDENDRCTMEQKMERRLTSGLWIYGPFQTEKHADCGLLSSSARVLREASQ